MSGPDSLSIPLFYLKSLRHQLIQRPWNPGIIPNFLSLLPLHIFESYPARLGDSDFFQLHRHEDCFAAVNVVLRYISRMNIITGGRPGSSISLAFDLPAQLLFLKPPQPIPGALFLRRLSRDSWQWGSR